MSNTCYSNKESLQKFLDDRENESFLDDMFADLFEIDLDKPCGIPYWLDSYPDDCKVEYMPGYWEPLQIGAHCTIEDQEYIYIDSQSLSEEIEHQADDGSLVYEYRGPSFLRIWQPVNLD